MATWRVGWGRFGMEMDGALGKFLFLVIGVDGYDRETASFQRIGRLWKFYIALYCLDGHKILGCLSQ